MGWITIDALVYAKAHGGWSLEKEARGQTKVRYEHKRFRFDFYTCPDFASEDVTWRRQGPSRQKRKVGGSADLSSSQRKIDLVPDLLLPRLPTRDKQRLGAITRSSLVARSYSFGRTSASPASVKHRDRDVTVNQVSQTVRPD